MKPHTDTSLFLSSSSQPDQASPDANLVCTVRKSMTLDRPVLRLKHEYGQVDVYLSNSQLQHIATEINHYVSKHITEE